MADFYPAGTILLIDSGASVQFTKPIVFRLIRALNHTTYYGWIWLEGYQLDENHEAIEKRSIFVQKDALKVLPKR